MADQETYAVKIEKLLRKAESTSPQEAELLYAKAQELMTKYAIDEAMLAAARGLSGKKDDPVISKDFVVVGIWRFPLGRLTYQILINNMIKAIQLSDPGWRKVNGKVYKETYVLAAVGLKSDIERASVLETSLHLQALRAENAWWADHSHLYSNLSKSKQHIHRRGFLFAFADGAGVKLREATQRGKAAAEAEHTKDSVALVLRDKSMAVKDEFNRLFPHTRQVKDRRNHGGDFARSHGYEAGQRADVGQPGFAGTRKGIGR